MGIKDVAALAEVIVDAARLGLDPGSATVLERYQRWRRFDTMAMGIATDGLNRLFSNRSDVLRLARDVGLGMVERLPTSSAYSFAKRPASSAKSRNCCAAKCYESQVGTVSKDRAATIAFNHIAVIGAGAWGSALALTCARAGRSVTLWEHDAANAGNSRKKRESLFLPGVRIDECIAIAADLADAARAQAILLVVPAQAVRSVAKALAPLLAAHTPVIVCAKGIERGTKKFMSQVVAECAPNAVPAILSGPSFAADVARGMPTAVTLAARDGKLAANWRRRSARRVPALLFHRRARRRDRRRGQECARHRRRRCRRPRPRRQRGGGADHARFCRAGAFRQSLRREGRDDDGPFRARRSL